MAKAKSKKSSRKHWFTKKRITIIVSSLLFIGVLFCAGYFVYYKTQIYDIAARQASLSSMREFVLQNATKMLLDAPINHETGDTYFPPFRIYLPVRQDPPSLPDGNQKLKYFSVQTDEEEPYLLVSSETIISYAESGLYGLEYENDMKGNETFWSKVPQVQACAWGYKLTFAKIPGGDTARFDFVQKIPLDNEKTVYVYFDKECKLLYDASYQIDFSGLRAY